MSDERLIAWYWRSDRYDPKDGRYGGTYLAPACDDIDTVRAYLEKFFGVQITELRRPGERAHTTSRPPNLSEVTAMNEEKDTASGNDWTRTMASVNDAFAKDPAASVNVMLRTMAFTARQSGRSFLVRHEDQDSNVVWLYHLGGETDVRITRKESLPGDWLAAEPRAAAWPTTGEQFERLQREADEHIKDPLGRQALLRRMRVWGESPEVTRKKMGIGEVEELLRASEAGDMP